MGGINEEMCGEVRAVVAAAVEYFRDSAGTCWDIYTCTFLYKLWGWKEESYT